MDLIERQDAIDIILSDKITGTSLDVMKALGDGRLALTLNDACDRHIRDIKLLQSVHPERKWNRLMMYLADLQLTYSPSWGAKGDGDEKLYSFVTELIEELEGWSESDG